MISNVAIAITFAVACDLIRSYQINLAHHAARKFIHGEMYVVYNLFEIYSIHYRTRALSRDRADLSGFEFLENLVLYVLLRTLKRGLKRESSNVRQFIELFALRVHSE